MTSQAHAQPGALNLSLSRSGLADQVADQIQELIVARQVLPGARLPSERELTAQLGVSRTVVREAVRTLQTRGLVEIKPGSGTYVRALLGQGAGRSMSLLLRYRWSPETVHEFYEMRRLIEVDAARLAALRATPEDLVALQKAMIANAINLQEPMREADHDLSFHAALADATHNTFYRMLLGALQESHQYLSGFTETAYQVLAVSLERHREVVACIADHDAEGAQAVMRRLLDEAEANAEALMRQEAAPQSMD
jgi:DNA-binding FadR family transcriptional regulator